MFIYQERARFFAQVAGGMEALGQEEIATLGAKQIQTAYRGLYFTADHASLYRINYASRLLTRVLAPLTTFRCHNPDYLYRMAREIDWRSFFSAKDTFAVFANVSNSKMRHSKYAALRVKDAIVDVFREEEGVRPSIDTRHPTVWINLHIENNQATISIDLSGGSLHRRGYRLDSVTAPMQETVAAAVIRLSGWEGEHPLYDPMCGSGTLLTEALMHYCKIPAGYLRKTFGFMQLPDYKQKTWQRVKQEADDRMRPLPKGLIRGNDRNPNAIEAARANAARLPGGKNITFTVGDFGKQGPCANTTILVNPPYGIRMDESAHLRPLYKRLGDYFKQQCTGSAAYVYAGERAMLKHVGLRSTWKKPLVNGALDGRLAKYELY